MEMIQSVAAAEEINLDTEAAEAITHVSLGDLRKAITALQVAASLSKDVTRDLIYETTATAPPEELHGYLLACREDGFQPARRRLKGLLDKYGLAGTDMVNQLHRGLGDVAFLDEAQKLAVTEAMAETDFRMVEGGGEALQLDAMTARICSLIKG
jgi:replication factor C small subunit